MVNLIKASNSKQGRWLHRWVGIVVAIYLVMATFSGSLHLLLSDAKMPPKPAATKALIGIDEATISLADIVSKIPANEEIKTVNIKNIAEDLWYQIISSEGNIYYINAETGEANKKLDAVYAREIAAAYLNTQISSLKQKAYLTEFDSEYLNYFGVLPVYRFDKKGKVNERVYVSTMKGGVTLYMNNAKVLEQKIFKNLHVFGFIPNEEVKEVLMLILVAGVFFTTIVGVGIFFGRIKKKK